MEANPTQIINYFSGFKQNLVPLFQRPYTWTEKQWRTLWEDVMSFYGYDPSETKSTHFMGAVVTMPARSVPVGVSKFLIIDGQQRLTTIALLMCAIRDSLDEAQVQRRRIQNYYLTNEGYEGLELFKLLPTQGDRPPYTAVIQGSGSAIPESQFKKSYEYFRRRLRDQVDEGEKVDPKRVLEIIESRLMVVMINLSDTDDPYLIFESLNFKGSPLEQADLVRNYFLMRFPVGEQQQIFETLWLPMQTRLGSNLTEFMRHFLGSEGEEARRSDVYASIKRLVTDADSASVCLLMSRMERLSALYGRISGSMPEPDATFDKYFRDFLRLDFGSVYPLLLTLYEDYSEGEFGAYEFVTVLKILHSFILRRMIVGVPSNSLSGLFISLCKTKPVTEAPSAWLSAALGMEDKNRRWPSDNEFEERWIHSSVYGSRACQLVLECLEEHSGHHEPAQLDEVSVEHIMPQTLTPEWEMALGPEGLKQSAEWLHTVGNLTLTGYNPELSNKTYSEKRRIFLLSHFELNRYFASCDSWGPLEIKDRAIALFKIALRMWPRPPMALHPTTPEPKPAPSGFHAECIELAQKKLDVHLSKLSQTRYQSGDGQTRLVCAVSAEHNESSGLPYFWFGVHKRQIEFLKQAPSSWLCFGCGSPETTLLIPLPAVQDMFDFMSITKTEDRHYWHVLLQRKGGRLILRLLGGKDGPDLTDFKIVNVAKTTV